MTSAQVLSRRKQLGLTDIEVAMKAGISIASYGDIESYDDEIKDNVDLIVLKKLSSVLHVPIFDFLDLKCEYCSTSQGSVKLYQGNRSEIIKSARSALGKTQDQLADEIGFEVIAVQEMESDQYFLETWTADLIKILASAIKVPVQILMDIQCPECGK
jgi:transcriptional regulator with XRE-family HTH domain